MSDTKKSRPRGQAEVEREPGAPVWIISFADLVCLMLTFFVMVAAFSSQQSAVDNEDIMRILASIKVGFGYKPKVGSAEPLDVAALQVLSTVGSRSRRDPSQMRWAPPAVKGQPDRVKDAYAKPKSAVGKPVLFSPGSAEISKNQEQILDEIAEIVRHHYRRIVIQGHASRKELLEDEDQGGFDLAYQRAVAVKQALVARGVALARIRLVSSGEYDTPESEEKLQYRAVVTLGDYFVPGRDTTELKP
jgi:chemotaxis protein MotB